jgi:polysaccharide export outer membrane protein
VAVTQNPEIGDFTLKPGLVLSISVMLAGRPEFQDPAKRISSAGEIGLPLLGSIKTTGETVESLEKRLTQLYSKFYVNPQVIVEFVPSETGDGISPWGYVTVLGRVRNPGRFALPPTRDLTVSGAIQNAGGFDTSAKDSAIKVTRRSREGGTDSLEVDLRAVGARGEVQNDILLKPGDVVFVPELMF